MKKQLGSVITYHSEARKAIAKGIDAVADLVQATMGPMGKNIIIERASRSPLITKDGVTVANRIHLKQHDQKMGAELCKSAAQKTNDVAGDGTTTAIVLTRAMLREGIRMIEAGFNPVKLKKGMDIGLAEACKALQALTIPADDYEKIFYAAAISAKEKEMGQLIAGAMEQVGMDGLIMIRESLEKRTFVEISPGMELNKGYLSPSFIAKGQRLVIDMNDTAVFLTDQIISEAADMEKIVRWCVDDKKSLLVVAKDVVRDALGILTDCNRSGRLQAAAVEAPSFGQARLDILEDLAAATGAIVISQALGSTVMAAKKGVLGHAEQVTVTRTKTMITKGGGVKTDIESRIRQLKAMLAQEKEEEAQKKIKDRIARLAGGVAVIRVGGTTRAAMIEQKYRVEDAVNAAQAAAKHGILPGGGTALVRATKALEQLQEADLELQAGIDLLATAMRRPLCQIVANARGDESRVLKNVENAAGWIGYDAVCGKLVDMLEAQIVDPAFVTTTALRNAVSIASTVLTMEVIIEDTGKLQVDMDSLTPEVMRKYLT